MDALAQGAPLEDIIATLDIVLPTNEDGGLDTGALAGTEIP
jgi:hypothetical protein